MAHHSPARLFHPINRLHPWRQLSRAFAMERAQIIGSRTAWSYRKDTCALLILTSIVKLADALSNSRKAIGKHTRPAPLRHHNHIPTQQRESRWPAG